MARTKGAVAKSIDNKAVRDYLLGYRSLSELPRIVEDCICGALGQEKESRGFSGARILVILRQLERIDTPTVHQQMWDYNISQGNHTEPSKRNTERMTKVLRCASGAIYHHLGLGSIQKPVFDLTKDEIEQVRHWALTGEIEMFKQFLSTCRVATNSYKLPEFKYSGENVVALSSNAEISLKPAVHRPYLGNFNEPIQDGQSDDLFTVGDDEKNLQPLIEEVGRSYMVVENVA